MNADHDNELEARIDHELKSLPPLAAPPTLVPRVMAVIAARAAAPWYRRAWPTWPIGLQAASLILLLAMFGGLCFAGWQLSHAAGTTAMAQTVGGVISVLNAVWNACGVLVNAGAEFIRHLRTGFILAFVTVVVLTCAACLAIGSACYRLAYAKP